MSTFYRLILSAILAGAAVIAEQLIRSDSSTGLSIDFIGYLIVLIACVLVAFISPALTGSSLAMPSLSRDREQGQVKWFNVSKGYGFVTRPSGEEIFVHFRSIRGKGRRVLREGQTVEFSVGEGDKGPQAEDVEPLA